MIRVDYRRVLIVVPTLLLIWSMVMWLNSNQQYVKKKNKQGEENNISRNEKRK